MPTFYEDLIREVDKNITWIKLNSNYNDPRYANLSTLYQNLLLNNSKLVRTNFSIVLDTKMVIDLSPVLQYGSIPCSAPNKEAFFDSNFACFLFQLPYFLEKIQFGYLCGIVIIPIILISIFGKIKESYRWFLLNQAIFDTFMCYSFICEKPSVLAWSGANYAKNSTCFYSGRSSNPWLDLLFTLIKGTFRNAPFVPLFLLAFSRCISLYFPTFYQRHNQTWKILLFIIIFNFVIILFFTLIIFLFFTSFQTYLQGSAMGYTTDLRIFQNLPYEIFLLQNSTTVTSLNIMRIFIDSFIVITVLSGYRKKIISFCIFVFNFIRFRGKKNHRIGTSVTIKSIRIILVCFATNKGTSRDEISILNIG